MDDVDYPMPAKAVLLLSQQRTHYPLYIIYKMYADKLRPLIDSIRHQLLLLRRKQLRKQRLSLQCLRLPMSARYRVLDIINDVYIADAQKAFR